MISPFRLTGWCALIALVVPLLLVPGCRTLQQVANLRQVDFAIDDVEDATLAGIDLDRIRSGGEVRAQDVLRLTTAVASGSAPLDFTLVLGADNPAENGVDARLVKMDWTLFLDDRETISGTFDQNILIAAGERTAVPIPIRLDLVEFFDRGARDLVELALAATGRGGEPKDIRLQARPTLDTPLGPISYPRPITIVSREVGADASTRGPSGQQ